jgi:hypothetical protein
MLKNNLQILPQLPHRCFIPRAADPPAALQKRHEFRRNRIVWQLVAYLKRSRPLPRPEPELHEHLALGRHEIQPWPSIVLILCSARDWQRGARREDQSIKAGVKVENFGELRSFKYALFNNNDNSYHAENNYANQIYGRSIYRSVRYFKFSDR